MEQLKVLLHVNNPERWDMAMLNIKRLIEDVGNDAVDIVVVANGPAVIEYTNKNRLSIIESRAKEGVKFYVCRTSIKLICPGGDVCMLDDPVSRVCVTKKGYIFKDICVTEEGLSSFLRVIPAGITEVVRKQHEGYAYVKP